MPSDGVGGLSVGGGQLFVTGRDAADQYDLLVSLDCKTGKRNWSHSYSAPADLDYGNSPRATPAVQDGVVVHLGATGQLVGLDGSTGIELWSIDLSRKFGLPITTWGFCGSPLIHGQRIYLQVAERPSLVAFDLFDGTVVWSVDGQSSAYSSLILAEDEKSIWGVSEDGYFQRRLVDGHLLWSTTREISGDFGVPAPVLVDGGVIFVGENNGLLFKANGSDVCTAVDDTLLPDSHTPVAIAGDIVVAFDGVHRIDLKSRNRKWSKSAGLASGYVSLIVGEKRAIAIDETGQVVLIGLEAGDVLDRAELGKPSQRVLSHPAIANESIYVRVGRSIRCYAMTPSPN